MYCGKQRQRSGAHIHWRSWIILHHGRYEAEHDCYHCTIPYATFYNMYVAFEIAYPDVEF
jgi:hypothetical protein